MHSLDSRSLHYVDCYAQRFAEPGTVRYELITPAGVCLPIGTETFTIEVADAGPGKGAQHTVVVRRTERGLRPDPEDLQIEAGDMVLWNTPDAAVGGYVVRGEGAGGGFDSSAIRHEAVYTHAFGSPGTYRWIDAHGSGVGGEVIVESLDCRDAEEAVRWQKALASGTLVTIRGATAEPQRVQILAGQTVFWSVENGDGISITDARVSGHARTKREPDPVEPTARS
jgi:plastocyanin